MSAPTPWRQDFGAPQVRGLARKTKDGPQARRLFALADIYDGATRTEAAKIGGVGLQIIRDWVLRFNARGPDGLLDGKSTGQPSKLNDTQRQAICLLKRELTISQVRAIEILLRKCVPDLAAAEIKSEETHRYVVEMPPVLDEDEWQRKYGQNPSLPPPSLQ